MGEIDTLAAWIGALSFEDLPEEVKHAASRCLLDTVSAAAGASGEPLIRNIRQEYLEPLKTAGEKKASVWGTEDTVPLFTAAFLNGMAAHYYELDDVHCESKTHIGTVVIPAAYAAAEYLGKDGKDLLTAIVCGYETAARIGEAFGVVSHRKKGWHSTSTAGVFGSAAACAKLLGLDEERTASALGLAGTQAFGRWAFLEEGASCKVLHSGRAAEIGCHSAFLAQAGMTGPHHILTAKDGGLLSGMSDSYDETRAAKDLGMVWAILNMDNKPYPCCRSTHCAIDAARSFHAAHKEMVSDIRDVLIETYEVGKKQCAESRSSLMPSTANEAKFSTPYTVACALSKGSIGLEDFREEQINDKEFRTLAAKVRVAASESYSEAYPAHWGCRMTVTLENGTQWNKEVTDASGGRDCPLTDEELKAKSRQLLARVGNIDIDCLQHSLMSIEACSRVPSFSAFLSEERRKGVYHEECDG